MFWPFRGKVSGTTTHFSYQKGNKVFRSRLWSSRYTLAYILPGTQQHDAIKTFMCRKWPAVYERDPEIPQDTEFQSYKAWISDIVFKINSTVTTSRKLLPLARDSQWKSTALTIIVALRLAYLSTCMHHELIDLLLRVDMVKKMYTYMA